MPTKDRLVKLRQLVKLHLNWLTVKLLGEDALSKEELAELKSYGKLPLGESIGLVESSYILGRLRATLKTSDYKKLNKEQLKEAVNTAKFSPVEKLAIQEAKLHAATNIKRLADDIAAGAFSRLSAQLSTTLTESVIQDIIKDETAIALAEKKTYQELASSLSKKLQDDWSRNWEVVAVTELHRAKVRGSVMAIINKIGPYKASDGLDSYVSIVPSASTCVDCSHHYVLPSGEPKVFTLRSLLQNGSNGDKGVTHERGAGGRHASWKTTLPPLHPKCACRVVYIPDGMGWKGGKLVVTDSKVFESKLSKAVDTSSLSATVKPPGPKSAQSGVKTVSAPSIEGAPAAGNTAGPGRPKSAGPKVEYDYWSGSGTPPQGAGWERSESGAWRRPKGAGMGRSKSSEESEEATTAATTPEEAKQWGSQSNPHAVVLSHLNSGDISDVSDLSTGVNPSSRITIQGNGRGCMKPAQDHSPEMVAGKSYTDGVGTVPHNTQPQNEVAAYNLFNAFGMDHCPPTTTRIHEGRTNSVQQWQEGKVEALAHMSEKFENGFSYSDLISSSKDPMLFRKQMEEITVMDLVMNSQDRHFGNLMFDEDLTEVKAIDHGVSFGSGMMGTKSVPFKMMNSGGYKLKLPEHLQERFKTTSYGDLKRALGDQHKDWQVGQTFLRMQYLQHCQETDGHLDYKRFQPFVYTATEDTSVPASWMWSGDSTAQAVDQIKNRTRANDLFEDFAIDFIDKHAADPNSVHHAAAKDMKEHGVFMGPGHVVDPGSYRREGQHKQYEAKIREAKVAAEARRKPAEDPQTPEVSPSDSSASDLGTAKTVKKQDVQSTVKRKDLQGTAKQRVRKGLYLEDINKSFLT